MPDEWITRADLDRVEERLGKRIETLEGRIWWVLSSVVLLVFGYLFTQVLRSGEAAPGTTPAIMLVVVRWIAAVLS